MITCADIISECLVRMDVCRVEDSVIWVWLKSWVGGSEEGRWGDSLIVNVKGVGDMHSRMHLFCSHLNP